MIQKNLSPKLRDQETSKLSYETLGIFNFERNLNRTIVRLARSSGAAIGGVRQLKLFHKNRHQFMLDVVNPSKLTNYHQLFLRKDSEMPIKNARENVTFYVDCKDCFKRVYSATRFLWPLHDTNTRNYFRSFGSVLAKEIV